MTNQQDANEFFYFATQYILRLSLLEITVSYTSLEMCVLIQQANAQFLPAARRHPH